MKSKEKVYFEEIQFESINHFNVNFYPKSGFFKAIDPSSTVVNYVFLHKEASLVLILFTEIDSGLYVQIEEHSEEQDQNLNILKKAVDPDFVLNLIKAVKQK